MTNDQKKDLAKLWALTAGFYDKTFTLDMVQLMVEDVAHLTFEQTKTALENFRKEPKNRTWPRPADIIAICNPRMSTDSLANEAASRIRAAISKYGWSNGGEAKNYIGELGWLIVTRSGGWQTVCETHGLDLNPLTFHAQARDLAKAILESNSHGTLDQPVQIEQANQNLIQFKIKEIPK